MTAILYGLLIAHFMAYKEQYANIGVVFATTVVIKTFAKVAGAKEQSELITIGGGALTIKQISILLKEITKGGYSGTVKSGVNPNGIMGEIVDALKGLVIK